MQLGSPSLDHLARGLARSRREVVLEPLFRAGDSCRSDAALRVCWERYCRDRNWGVRRLTPDDL